MTEKHQKTAKKFQEFLATRLREVETSKVELTSFPYGKDETSQKEKMAMTVALIFWKFLRKLSENMPHYTYTQKEKRKFIAAFMAESPIIKENRLAKTVAMIESLPTLIWRKLLWRENIDFSDYEPCLRRLSKEQRKEIENNYHDLFSSEEPMTPRVLKKSWRDRIKLFFGIISVKKILENDYQEQERKQSKGAYAFSLLGLDFGFSLYPKGDNNDTKITNKKYTRFFSVKEHINDFIVNKEDGKYWWLYKTARSNYAINPGHEVKMRNHVCPGFWLTLILHFLFWIVSPIALIVTGVVVAKNGLTPLALIPAAFAFTMIIWSVIAVVRTIFNFSNKLIVKSKIVKVFVITILVTTLIGLVGVIIYYVFTFLWSCVVYLAPICGSLLAVLFILAAIFYIIFFFTCVITSDPAFEYKDVPKFMRALLHLAIFGFAVVMFDKFLAEHVISAIVFIAQGFWGWYTSDLLLSNWFILALGFFGLFMYFYNMFLTDEKRFTGFRKTFTWLSRGFLSLTVIVFVSLFLKSGNVDFVEFGIIPALSASLIFLAFGFSLLMLEQVTPDNIDERMMASEFINKINSKITGLSYKGYISKIMGSKWLLPLTKEERWQMIYQIEAIAFDLFKESRSYRTSFIDLMISKGSIALVKTLSLSRENIERNSYDEKETFKTVKMIVEGLTIQQAFGAISARRTAYREFSHRAEIVIDVIVYPFVKIYEAISWVCRKIKQFFCTLKDLWDFFNKRCPFVSQPRYLD